MDITELLAFTVKNKASDLHLSAGMQPILRVEGDIRKMKLPILRHKEVHRMIYDIMDDQQRKNYEINWETDFCFNLPNVARFRVNAFRHHRGAGAVFRVILKDILTLEDLNAPPILKKIAQVKQGLVIVTGPTGCGKSTTLASLIDYKNKNEHGHIITIEDPVEFIHQSQKSLINQREVYKDTKSFQLALRSALREDPDTIMIGEMRDLETIRLALTAAETGHLVFATLHTNNAPKTISRILDIFPATEKEMMRAILSESLKAVIAQKLLKKTAGGRIAAYEVLIGTPAVRNLIREKKIAQLRSTMQTNYAKGMQTLEQSLQHLLHNGLISRDEAHLHTENVI